MARNSRMERQMFTKSTHASAAQSSYFNYVMTKRFSRRAAISFAQATGLLPELVFVSRAAPFARAN
jgi:hypothetical protein